MTLRRGSLWPLAGGAAPGTLRLVAFSSTVAVAGTRGCLPLQVLGRLRSEVWGKPLLLALRSSLGVRVPSWSPWGQSRVDTCDKSAAVAGSSSLPCRGTAECRLSQPKRRRAVCLSPCASRRPLLNGERAVACRPRGAAFRLPRCRSGPPPPARADRPHPTALSEERFDLFSLTRRVRLAKSNPGSKSR